MPFRDGLTFMVYDKQLVIFTSIHSYVVEILEFIQGQTCAAFCMHQPCRKCVAHTLHTKDVKDVRSSLMTPVHYFRELWA